MIEASALRSGMVIRWEGASYRVVAAEYHAGGGKMGGVAHARLRNLETGSVTERRFRGDERVEDLASERRTMEFSYQDGEAFVFMDPQSFEQVPISQRLIGPAARFLQPGVQMPVDFLGERPIGVAMPETVEIRVAGTAPPMHAAETSALKEATLDNGLVILVPLFIKPGELVRVDVESGRYVERVKAEGRRGA
jgi:elongation factor P